jgi:hypothetical protein
MTNASTEWAKAAASYRKAAKNLRVWSKPPSRWPTRSLADDVAQASSLLEAAAQMVEALGRRK